MADSVHFDVEATLQAVQAQDLGLIVTTNNPKRCRELLYAAMRADESLRCFVYAIPRAPNSFMLLKKAAPGAEEPLDAQ